MFAELFQDKVLRTDCQQDCNNFLRSVDAACGRGKANDATSKQARMQEWTLAGDW